MSRPRVVLVEAHAAMAAELRALLAPTFDVEVVGSAPALEAACERRPPDVIVSGVAMAGDGALRTLVRLRARCPTLPVVLLSVGDARALVRIAQLLRASAIVMKEDAGDELVAAVTAALEGRGYRSATASRATR